MKNIILSGLLILGAQMVSAQETLRVISDETYDMEINMDSQNVKCLVGDYSMSTLKIVIPQLKYYTSLDHTSGDSGGPCVSAGRCNKVVTDDRLKDLIVAKPTELIKVNIKKVESFLAYTTIVDAAPDRCQHEYREEITTIVRGIPFSHTRSMLLSEVSLADCK